MPHPNFDEFISEIIARGFAVEVAGGGSEILSRYWPNGYHMWITDADGSGMPAERNWCVCLYLPGQDEAASRNDIRSPDVRGSVFDALDMLEKRIPA